MMSSGAHISHEKVYRVLCGVTVWEHRDHGAWGFHMCQHFKDSLMTFDVRDIHTLAR
jgi:hypothetical protein